MSANRMAHPAFEDAELGDIPAALAASDLECGICFGNHISDHCGAVTDDELEDAS